MIQDPNAINKARNTSLNLLSTSWFRHSSTFQAEAQKHLKDLDNTGASENWSQLKPSFQYITLRIRHQMDIRWNGASENTTRAHIIKLVIRRLRKFASQWSLRKWKSTLELMSVVAKIGLQIAIVNALNVEKTIWVCDYRKLFRTLCKNCSSLNLRLTI